MIRSIALIVVMFLIPIRVWSQDSATTLPGTQPLQIDRPLDVVMVEGIDRFCLNEIVAAQAQRESRWFRDYTNAGLYEKALAPYRERFRTIIGAVDRRPDRIRFELPLDCPAKGDPASNHGQVQPGYSVIPNRWPTLPGITAEGLVLSPNDPHWKGLVIVVPDARWSPDRLAGATPGNDPPISKLPQTLAENGFLVVIPTLINRDDDFAGNPEIAMTNNPQDALKRLVAQFEPIQFA